jgi:hypothetical protein
VWVRVPQRRQLPMAKLVDALVKNGNPLTFKDCYSKNYIALLTPWSSVRVRPGSFEDR